MSIFQTEVLNLSLRAITSKIDTGLRLVMQLSIKVLRQFYLH